MLDLLGHVPLPLLLALGGAASYFAWRYLGKNGAILAAGLTVLAAMFRMGRTAEQEDRRQKDTTASLDTIRTADDARRDVRESIRTPEDVRADDGFRRPAPPSTPAPPPPPPAPQPVDVDRTLRADDGFRRK